MIKAHSSCEKVLSSQNRVQWSKFRKLQVPPKVKIFLWRLCNKALPSKLNLEKREINVEEGCKCCGNFSESLSHIFFECP